MLFASFQLLVAQQDQESLKYCQSSLPPLLREAVLLKVLPKPSLLYE